MAFAVTFDDEGIDQIIRDYHGTDIGCLIASDCRCSADAASRLSKALIYDSVSIRSSVVPAENLLPLVKSGAKRVAFNNAVFQSNPNPFQPFVSSLETLDFSHTNLDDRVLEPFQASRTLQQINCINTNVTIRSVELATTIRGLRNLNIGGNGIGLWDLAKLKIPASLSVMV